MSEQSQGVGWWLASDGRWYPPELRPGVAPAADGSGWAAPGSSTYAPTRTWNPSAPYQPGGPHDGSAPTQSPPTKRNTGRWLLIAAFGTAVALVAVVAVLSTKSEHRNPSAGSSVDAPAAGRVVTAHNGTISLTLPDGWRGADVSNGVQGIGPEIFPDDASAASMLEQRLSVLPRAVVLFGVRASSPTRPPAFADNVNVLSDPTVPPTVSLDQAGSAEARSVQQFATVTDQGVVDLGPRKAYRYIYTTPNVSGVGYVIKGAQDTWVLTYTFGSTTADTELAQASASTFDAP